MARRAQDQQWREITESPVEGHYENCISSEEGAKRFLSSGYYRLPSNYRELLETYRANPPMRRLFRHVILSLICCVTRIELRSGLPGLERVLDDEMGVAWSKGIDLTHHLQAKLIVSITVEHTNLYEDPSKGSSRQYIHFSFLNAIQAQTDQSCPQNRFAAAFGASSFCSVQFSLPFIPLEDVMAFAGDEEVTAPSEIDPIQERMRLRFAQQRALLSDEDQNDSDIRQAESRLQARLSQDLAKIVGQPLQFAGETWQLVSTNISGALSQKYVYSCEPPESVLRWAMPLEALFPPAKPMHTFLRMSLFNTTAVLGVDANIMRTPGVVQYSSDVESSSGGAPMNDGSGRISVELMQAVMKGYRKHWFSLSTQTVPRPEETALQSLRSASGSDGSNSQRFSWPSVDLPDPETLSSTFCPSAIQIRFRGCKGMLVLDDSLPGRTMILTPSMIKFITPRDDVLDALYVVGITPEDPLDVMLTSELVSVFEGLCQVDQRQRLTDYLTFVLLKERRDCEGLSLIDLVRNPEAQKKLLLSRGEISKWRHTPLLTSQTFPSYILRLNVPLPFSATLYGVPDFTGVLAENEVYLAINGTPVQGPVLLGKTPCLQREDMVLFQAVAAPQLNHLNNVLVFSVRGESLVPSQISSADLDGDHFYVLRDPELLACLHEVRMAAVSRPSNEFTMVKPWADGQSTAPDDWKEVENWEHNLQEGRNKALQVLRENVNSFEFCSLPHLLELRRRILDERGWDWPADDIACRLATLITATFEAPKHGSWARWTDLDDFVTWRIPRFPHHYQLASARRVRHSVSLFGQLFDRMLGELCDDIRGAQKTTLADQIRHWECYARSHSRSAKYHLGDPWELKNKYQRVVYDLPAASVQTLLQAVAFFLVSPVERRSYPMNESVPPLRVAGLLETCLLPGAAPWNQHLLLRQVEEAIRIPQRYLPFEINGELVWTKLKWTKFFSFLIDVIEYGPDLSRFPVMQDQFNRYLQWKEEYDYFVDQARLQRFQRRSSEFEFACDPTLAESPVDFFNHLQKECCTWLRRNFPNSFDDRLGDDFCSPIRRYYNKLMLTGWEKGDYLFLTCNASKEEKLIKLEILRAWLDCMRFLKFEAFTVVHATPQPDGQPANVLEATRSLGWVFSQSKSFMLILRARLTRTVPENCAVTLMDDLENFFA